MDFYNYCSNCGSEGTLEYFESEWVKYCNFDSEEIVSIYKCEKCSKKYTKRVGNFDLEMR